MRVETALLADLEGDNFQPRLLYTAKTIIYTFLMIAIYRLGEGVQAFPCSENLAFGCQARGAFPFPVPKRWAKDTNRYAQFSFES